MTGRVAALTGATGFLGVHLVRALSQAGWQVRALARREPQPPGWGEAQPQRVAGDLGDAGALQRLVEGASLVIHAAGAIKGDPPLLMEVNRDGAARLAQVAGRYAAPHAQLLLISSLAARSPELSAYGASKRAGEVAAAEAFPPERLTIVRPPAIYGPGDRETFTIFKAAALSPVLPLLSPKARLALIHVQDAAEAIVALGQGPGGGTYALADAQPQGYGWREILGAAASAANRRPLIASAPGWLLPGLARASQFVARMNGRPPLLHKDKVAELLHPDWGVSPAELAPRLGVARFGLADGFAQTFSWYVNAGWIRVKSRS